MIVEENPDIGHWTSPLYLSSMIGGWSPATAARSSASSFSSTATFFTIKPSKFKAIPSNPPSFIGPQIIASPSPPLRLRSPFISSCGGIYKLCSDCCFDLFVCGVLAASAIFCADPAAAIVTRIPSTYPCEDVGGYYSSVVDGLEGAPLMEKLSSIVSAHRSIPYRKVWEALEILDAADADNPESSPDIIEIYSQRAVPKALAGKPEGWNREHLWPRSYGLRDGRSLTDLHNLRPADVNVNSSRGNKFYGECAVKSTNCLRPANREAAKDTETDNHRWAPPLQVRGDISRSLMYMALCYRFHEPDGKPQLQLSDSPNIEMKEMGLLSALLRWNELDPPSRVEQLRNDRICRLYQHNRNPFVDHPEYANLIWKHSTQGLPTAYKLSKASMNEFRYKK